MNQPAQPFRAELIREFIVGLSVLGVLLAVLLLTAYRHVLTSFCRADASVQQTVSNAGTAKEASGQPRSSAPVSYGISDSDPSASGSSDAAAISYFPNPEFLQSEPSEVDSTDSAFAGVPAEQYREATGGDQSPYRVMEPEPVQGRMPQPTPAEITRLSEAQTENMQPILLETPPSAINMFTIRSPHNQTDDSRSVPTDQQLGPAMRLEEDHQFAAQRSDTKTGSLETIAPEPASSLHPQTDSNEPQELIRRGDSYWIISQRVYGRGDYFRALYEYNRQRYPDPDVLPVAASISTPDPAKLQRAFPLLCPGRDKSRSTTSELFSTASNQSAQRRSYVVRPGDTLFRIARYELGQAARYVDILRLNRKQLDGRTNQLRAGMTLLLPARDS